MALYYVDRQNNIKKDLACTNLPIFFDSNNYPLKELPTKQDKYTYYVLKNNKYEDLFMHNDYLIHEIFEPLCNRNKFRIMLYDKFINFFNKTKQTRP